MMTGRPLATVDRVAALIVGLMVTAVGVGAALWPTGLLAVPPAITVEQLVSASHSAWWPWAVAAAGMALVVVALSWLFFHLPTGKGPALHVREPGDCGVITVDLGAVAAAAAAALAQEPGVRTARGKAVTERGTHTIVLTVTLDHPSTLTTMIGTIDATCVHIATVTADSTVAARTVIQLPSANSARTPLE